MSGIKLRQVVRHSNLTIEIRVAFSLVSRNYCSCALCSGNSSTICTSTDRIAVLSESSKTCQRVYNISVKIKFWRATYSDRFIKDLQCEEFGGDILRVHEYFVDCEPSVSTRFVFVQNVVSQRHLQCKEVLLRICCWST